VLPFEDASIAHGSLEALLHRVYVGGGFTDPDVAVSVFAERAVRERGQLLVSRERDDGALTGMVIVVPPDSPARRLAASDEAEMHLLAVSPEHRKAGIGSALVSAALEAARAYGVRRMLLWTQPTMKDAHRLYERFGFTRIPARDFERAGRSFLVFEKAL
jgi:ribosomal protein S18 acetylase RimI-like enzyme